MNSFQAATNVKITAVTKPGSAIGSVTRRSACTLVQPSIRAASSISTGMLEKKPDSSQIAKAKLNPAFKIMRARYESSNLKKSTSLKIPIINAVGENI